MKFNTSFALLFLMQLIILVVYHFFNKSSNVGILIALFIPTFIMGIHIILSLVRGKGIQLLENKESMNTNAYRNNMNTNAYKNNMNTNAYKNNMNTNAYKNNMNKNAYKNNMNANSASDVPVGIV
jgi:hypothetical protein